MRGSVFLVFGVELCIFARGRCVDRRISLSSNFCVPNTLERVIRVLVLSGMCFACFRRATYNYGKQKSCWSLRVASLSKCVFVMVGIWIVLEEGIGVPSCAVGQPPVLLFEW